MEILQKTFLKIEKIESPNPLSNPGLDVHKPRYRRIPKSPGKIVKIQKSRIAIGKRFLNIFEHKIFLVNHHEADFSLVFHPLRARGFTPPDTQPPSCEGKENVFKQKNSNPKLGVTINNMFLYQYKLQYQYKSYMTLTLTLRTLPSESKLIGRVQPTSTSTSRLTSGKALRSTLRLTLTPNNNNVYQFTIYITLTLRKTTSESKNIGRVQPTSTSRLTSGKALRSTLRLTLTPNNNNVYQFTIYITLTLRKMTSEINKESHKDPRNADKKCITLALSSTSRLTSGLAVRTTLRLTLNMTFNTNSIWCKISATLSSTETSNPTGEKKSMIKTTVARKT
jgi:hypothetical protein